MAISAIASPCSFREDLRRREFVSAAALLRELLPDDPDEAEFREPSGGGLDLRDGLLVDPSALYLVKLYLAGVSEDVEVREPVTAGATELMKAA